MIYGRRNLLVVQLRVNIREALDRRVYQFAALFLARILDVAVDALFGERRPDEAQWQDLAEPSIIVSVMGSSDAFSSCTKSGRIPM